MRFLSVALASFLFVQSAFAITSAGPTIQLSAQLSSGQMYSGPVSSIHRDLLPGIGVDLHLVSRLRLMMYCGVGDHAVGGMTKILGQLVEERSGVVVGSFNATATVRQTLSGAGTFWLDTDDVINDESFTLERDQIDTMIASTTAQNPFLNFRIMLGVNNRAVFANCYGTSAVTTMTGTEVVSFTN